MRPALSQEARLRHIRLPCRVAARFNLHPGVTERRYRHILPISPAVPADRRHDGNAGKQRGQLPPRFFLLRHTHPAIFIQLAFI